VVTEGPTTGVQAARVRDPIKVVTCKEGTGHHEGRVWWRVRPRVAESNPLQTRGRDFGCYCRCAQLLATSTCADSAALNQFCIES
jgi:hypothetical protein